MLTTEDLGVLTVVQLKERLRAANLPVSGKKAELISRLEAHYAKPLESDTELIRPPSVQDAISSGLGASHSQNVRLQPVKELWRPAPAGRPQIDDERGWGDRKRMPER